MTIIARTISGHRCLFELDDWLKFICHGMSVCVKPDGYKTLVFSSGPHKTKLVHRVIMTALPYQEVDHKNGDTLDGTRDNLRLCNSRQNKSNTKSKRVYPGALPKGVIKHGIGYKATITVNYKQLYLGTFVLVEQAEAAYKAAAEKYQGEFALHLSREET